jgi:hypothetical protein
MATNLTSIAIKTRKGIRYGIYFLILIMIGRLGLGFAKNLKNTLFPPPPPPPTVGFSKLPAIPFPNPVEVLPQFEFSLETASGSLPQFPESMKVYYMPKAAPTLDSVDIAKKKAVAMGFDTDPIEISQTVFRFRQTKVPSSLEMNIITGTFSISYNLAADPSPIETNPPAPETANDIVSSVLKSANSMPEDLTVFGNPEFLKVEGQNLVSALSLSESDLVRVNLFRKSFGDKEEYPSLPPKKTIANVWFIISGAREREKQIIAAEFHYYPVDENKFETYPLKTPEEAFNDLKNGNGFIANLGLNKDGKVTIRKVYLAYYDPDAASQFYQPIVVFEGDKGFFAYVPAVAKDYYGEGE